MTSLPRCGIGRGLASRDPPKLPAAAHRRHDQVRAAHHRHDVIMNTLPSSGVGGHRTGAAMARYFFDVRDGDRVIADPDGLEFADLAAVREEAATALAEMARDSLPTTTRRRMSIDVRTDTD